MALLMLSKVYQNLSYVGYVTSGYVLISGILYAYHDLKAKRIYRKLYAVENYDGTPIENVCLHEAERRMQVYNELCSEYLLFKVLIGPPKVNFHLLPSKTSVIERFD